jgi:hypothetical protein
MSSRIARVALASCLVTLASLTARSEDISSAEDGWAAMKRCAALAEDKARHACTDETLREAGLLGAVERRPTEGREAADSPHAADNSYAAESARSAETARPAESAPAIVSRQSFGLPPPPAPKPSPSDTRLQVTLANVAQSGDGKLVLTTTDGATWRQVESEAIRPMPAQGQTMTIARKSLGGFMCESAQRVAFRCYRIR